jgi:hypothetical protein
MSIIHHDSVWQLEQEIRRLREENDQLRAKNMTPYKGQTVLKAPLRVSYGIRPLVAISEDEAVGTLLGDLAMTFALDTENYGRLLYKVPVSVTEPEWNIIELGPMQNFILEATDLLLVKAIRLSVVRGSIYTYPLNLNGQKEICDIALAAGARVILQPPLQRRFENTTYRAVLENPYVKFS